MKLLREKEQRREHAASKTQINGCASTIHDPWHFFIQDVLISGKKEGKHS